MWNNANNTLKYGTNVQLLQMQACSTCRMAELNDEEVILCIKEQCDLSNAHWSQFILPE